MNREIKFKAWNIATKTMVDLRKITPLVLNEDINGLFIPDSDGIIIMQFTGIKDKNGVEIYEGDIIKSNQMGDNVVEDITEIWLTNSPTFDALQYGIIEVIGNIYE